MGRKCDKTIILSEELTIRLIQSIENMPELWNKTLPHYKMKESHEAAWQKLSNEYNIPTKDLKDKWKSLRGAYRSNLSKVRESRVTGSATNDIFEPSWFAFEAMQFLNENMTAGETIDTETIDIEPQSSTSTTRGVKRARITQDSANGALGELIDLTSKVMKRHIAKKNDQSDAFEKYVHCLLQKKNPMHRSEIESRIIQMIAEYPDIHTEEEYLEEENEGDL